MGTELVILLGALLADSPHTRPVPVTAAVSDAELSARLHVDPVDYKGPTGIVGVLQHACVGRPTRLGVPVGGGAALRGPAAQPQGHAGAAAGVEDILDVTLPLADLPDDARAWERGVDELADQDTEVAEYVRTLEEAAGRDRRPPGQRRRDRPRFERYLRRRGEPGG